MSLSDREKQVLAAIIDYYLLCGDTVGSRTLVKKYGMNFSSATIRNVMADLEDMGYIMKTHTSSGRVPTDMGYKFYLNELIKIEKLSREEMNKIDMAYEMKMKEIESVLKKTSRLLSKLSTYAGIVIEPDIKREKIKKVELVHVNDYLIMAVIVMENSAVRTKKIQLETRMSEEDVYEISKDLNIKIKKEEMLSHEVEHFIKEQNEQGGTIVDTLEKEVYQDIEGAFFVNGTSEIFKNKSVDEVKDALELFSHKKNLREVFEIIARSRGDEKGKVHVIFGDELNIQGLEDYSFVYSVYKIGQSEGIIGVIGPKRMAYSKTVGLVEYVTDEVNKVIDEIEREKE